MVYEIEPRKRIQYARIKASVAPVGWGKESQSMKKNTLLNYGSYAQLDSVNVQLLFFIVDALPKLKRNRITIQSVVHTSRPTNAV